MTSPGGTTIAAIRELENHGVRAALLAAIEAACVRSRRSWAPHPPSSPARGFRRQATPLEHLSLPPHRYRYSHRQHVRVWLVGGEADAATRAEGTGDVVSTSKERGSARTGRKRSESATKPTPPRRVKKSEAASSARPTAVDDAGLSEVRFPHGGRGRLGDAGIQDDRLSTRARRGTAVLFESADPSGCPTRPCTTTCGPRTSRPADEAHSAPRCGGLRWPRSIDARRPGLGPLTTTAELRCWALTRLLHGFCDQEAP